MCGIVGLLVKNPALRDRLGELMLPMLIGMSERGPESAGLAVFTEAVAGGRRKFSVYSGSTIARWETFAQAAMREFGADAAVSAHANHAVLETAASPAQVKAWLADNYPEYHLLSAGRSIDLYKDTGTPARSRDALRLRAAVGHARGRPYADGDRIGRLARARPSLHGRRGLLPGPQRLAVESVQRAPQAGAAGHPLRDRQRHRGRLPVPRMADARRRHARERARTRASTSSTASTRC